jgi:hypothetical protein
VESLENFFGEPSPPPINEMVDDSNLLTMWCVC